MWEKSSSQVMGQNPLHQSDHSYFVFLSHLVTHPWNLQYYPFVLVRYGLTCPEFAEISFQCLWKDLNDFVNFACSYLHLVRYPMKLEEYIILSSCRGS